MKHRTYREKRQLFQLLVKEMEQQDWGRAIRTARELQGSDVKDREMYQAILAAYIDGNAPEYAEECRAEYLAKFSLDGVGHFYLGRLAFLQGKWEAAETHFQAALADDALTGWYRGATYSIYATLTEKSGGEPEKVIRLFQESMKYKDILHGKGEEYSNYLFNLHYLARPQTEMLQAAQGYGRLFSSWQQYDHSRHKKIRKSA